MLNFIWQANKPMLAGTGGSETYTAGHVRELNRRGIEARVVTIGKKAVISQKDFPDIPFLHLNCLQELSALDGQIIYVNRPYAVKTQHKPAVIFHCARSKINDRQRLRKLVQNMTVIVTSKYNAEQIARILNLPSSRIHIVLPFADPSFAISKRPEAQNKINIIYAGRLHPEKGIYTILELLKKKEMIKNGFSINIVAAGQHESIGKIIANILRRHPLAKIIPPLKSVDAMASLLAKTDILLMPSIYAEPFGMLSVEAQHSGCRVVASKVGGIPETDCGLLKLVKPGSANAFLDGLISTAKMGPATKLQRITASKHFTLEESVNSLLKVVIP